MSDMCVCKQDGYESHAPRTSKPREASWGASSAGLMEALVKSDGDDLCRDFDCCATRRSRCSR